MSLSIGMLGTGAIGTLMAWKWQQQACYAIPRAQQTGFSPSNEKSKHLMLDQQAFQLPLWQTEPLDWLVVTTKAADTLTALSSLQPKLPLISHILLLQNGVGQQQEVEHWLSEQTQAPSLWVGTSTEAAFRQADAQVTYAGRGETWAGPWSPDTRSLSHSIHLPKNVQLDLRIKDRLFKKLAINAVINPLTAVYGCKNGALLTPSFKPEFEALTNEVEQFFIQMNWPIAQSFAQQVTAVAQATANNTSSTLQDIQQQRPTELPYITGYLLAEASKKGLVLPISQGLMAKLSEMVD